MTIKLWNVLTPNCTESGVVNSVEHYIINSADSDIINNTESVVIYSTELDINCAETHVTYSTEPYAVNTLRPKQNGPHFPDDIFKCFVFTENVRNPIKMSLKFVPKGPINIIPALTIIGSDNGLWPGRRQAIIWTNYG